MPFQKLCVKCFLISCFLLLIIYILGCNFSNEFNVTIYNKLDTPIFVYLDNTKQGEIAAGSKIIIEKVETGIHILSAEANGYKPIKQEVNVVGDIEWIIQNEIDI
jgi:hypothetical protein